MEKKPEKGGMPDRASPPITKQANVNGIAFLKPFIFCSDCSPPIAPMIEPAPMNSSALKNAWVIK